MKIILINIFLLYYNINKKMFKCFFKVQQEPEEKMIMYETFKDNVYTLKNRIDCGEIEETKFDKEYLEEYEKILEKHKDDIHYRHILFHKLLLKIDYEGGIRDININIEDIRYDLYKKIKNLPTYFQQNNFIINKKKLEKVVFKEIHIDNIKLLIELL